MEGAGSSLAGLPCEVIEEILLSPSLSVQDICRMRQVCWHIHSIVARLWTKIATSRWKGWGSISGSTHEEWYVLCCQRCQCECQVFRTLDHLSRRCLKLQFTDEDELAVFSTLLKQKKYTSDILLYVLSDILETPHKTADMTQQFYALYGKEYIIRQKLFNDWKRLLQLPTDEQTMEKGAILLAQWMRPCHCPEATIITKQLDSIAEMVAVQLLSVATDTTEEKEKDNVEVKKLRRSVELVRGSHSVDDMLSAINTVLYDQLGFRGAGESYYELENSYIDMVLERKRGIPISLCTVYEAVARRLGLKLDPVNFPQHFVLRVAHREGDPPPTASDRIIIDAYSRGQRVSLSQMLLRVSQMPPPTQTIPPLISIRPASPANVYARFMKNLSLLTERQNIERIFHSPSGQWLPIPLLSLQYLRLALAPLAKQSQQFSFLGQGEETARICLELHYNPQSISSLIATESLSLGVSGTRYIRSLLEIVLAQRSFQSQVVTPKLRPITTNVKYSVGMIMKHRRFDYRCVIYGWDESCKMSEAWIRQMGVDLLPLGREQPFYNVLAHDGSNRYPAQVNLMECPSEELGPIPHWEVGKYFTHFTGKRYTPNHALREVYPDDL